MKKKPTIMKLSISLIFCCTLLIAGTHVNAKERTKETDTLNYPWEKFSVSLGGFITGLSTDILYGSEQLGLGLAINMEDALGLETSSFVLRGETDYNFGKRERHQIGLRYFGFFRNSVKVLESEITIGDQVYPIGSEIDSRFDMQIFKTTYKYAYFIDSRVKLGASIGLYIMPINFSISSLGSLEEASKFIAPLPVLGLDAEFAITPKLLVKQGIDVLYLQIEEFKGTITDVNFRIEYNPWKHIGFGVGYDSYLMSIKNANPGSGIFDFVGSFKSGYTGILFYGKFFF